MGIVAISFFISAATSNRRSIKTFRVALMRAAYKDFLGG